MKKDKAKAWLLNNFWIFICLIGLFALVGLALPLVRPHLVEYNAAEWAFEEGDRVDIGVGALFGQNGAVLWPYIVIYALIIVATFLPLIGFALKKQSAFLSASLLLFILCAVLLFISSFFYGYINALATVGQYKEELGDYFYWYIQEYVGTADARLGIGAMFSAALCVIGAVMAFSASVQEDRMTIRDITEIAMLCAGSIVLDVIFHFLPNIPGQVGSISIACVPLYLIAIRHGPARGFFSASIVYGLLTCLTDGYGLYLYPLDYFVGFSGVAIIGFFRNFILAKGQTGYTFKSVLFIVLGVLAGSVVRLFGSGLSSIFNYGYTFNAALIANLYTLLSGAACLVVLLIIFKPFLMINRQFPVKQPAHEEDEGQEE